MYLKPILAAVLVFASAVSIAANIPCHNCSEAAYSARAVGAGIGRHYVFDYPRGNLRHYFVACGSGPNSVSGADAEDFERSRAEALRVPAVAAACGVGSSLLAEIQENAPEIVHGFIFLKQRWDQNGGTMKSATVIDYEDIPGSADFPNASAYSVASNANFRSALGLMAARVWTNLFAGVLGAGESFAGFTQGIVIVIKIKFPDGTTSQYTLTYPRERADYDPNNSFTPNGQLIPEANQANYAGIWANDMGRPGAYEDFVRHVQQLGIPIDRCSTRATQCTWDGRTLRCRCL